MIELRETGLQKLEARFDGASARLKDELRRAMTRITLRLQAYVKTEKLSGQVLNRRTGTLSRSITSKVEESGASIVGIVGTNSGTVPYAAIHEFGGRTKPHVIMPKNKQALKFIKGGKTIFAKKVNHPGSKFPVRSYLRSSLQESRGAIRDDLQIAVNRAAR